MHFFVQDLLIALMIGAEVFAIAALWPLSEWAIRSRSPWPLVGSLLAIVACVAPDAHAMAGRLAAGWTIGPVLDWALLALLLVFPDAVCVVSAQSLARAGMPARWARATALAVAGVAVLVAPLATIVAGCSLVGACY